MTRRDSDAKLEFQGRWVRWEVVVVGWWWRARVRGGPGGGGSVRQGLRGGSVRQGLSFRFSFRAKAGCAGGTQACLAIKEEGPAE